MKGFGKKAEENLLAAFAAGADGRPRARMTLSKALPVAEELVATLRDHPAAIRVELAGSARRLADTVKDIDIVAASSDPAALTEAFAALASVDSVSVGGEAGARAVTHSGLPVDLRIVPEEAFGNLLQHFTGSGKHNEALRTEAVRRGLHVSEYGISDDESGESEAFLTEEEVYERLGMAFIPPELRENRGELEAARKGKLPELIEQSDIRGDLHMHTTLSDGHASVEEMAEAARELGYDYVAITDHSATHGFGNDVPPGALLARVEEIRSLPDLGITVLAGTESNVMTDGTLDYADGVLEQLDWVIASLHTSFRQSEKQQTERMLRAMEHPLVDAIGHPTGQADRAPRAVRARRGPRDRQGGRDRHLPRDQREPEPARPQRRVRARGRGGGRDARGEQRRPLAGHADEHALRRGHRPARVAHEGAGGEHAPLGRGGEAPQARALAQAGSIRRMPGRRRSFGAPNGDVRSNQNSTPSRPSIAATALDWRRHTSATSRKKPVATTGTCGRKKPIAPARIDSTASGQSRLNITAPGSSCGSEFVLRASASSRAMPSVVRAPRPSHSPARAARHHQTAATYTSVFVSAAAAPATETIASAVAAPP